MKLIYLAHPFDGKQENVEKVQKIITGLLHKMQQKTVFSNERRQHRK